MSPDPKQFAALLTEGIRRIRIRENKTINAIQDELSWALNKDSDAALAYWRQGHIPSKPEEVALLARQIAIRSDVDRTWVAKFLRAGGHPNPESILHHLFWESHVGQTAFGQDFPPRTYPRLVGRDPLILQALEILRNPEGSRLIGIDGLGGIGKTALAREIAQRALQEGVFEKAIWISAATNQQSYRVPAENRALTFSEMLGVIVRQMASSPTRQGEPLANERETWLRQQLHQTRTLLILDNIETASTPQDEIASRLMPLLGFSRALLTSRQRFAGPVYTLRLTGLAEQEALEFIQMAASQRNIQQVSATTADELASLIKAAGGSPLAMELMVGQLQYLPLSIIVTHLKEVRPLAVNLEKDEDLNLYKYIYQRTWELLTENGRELLTTLAQFTPRDGELLEVLSEGSALHSDILPRHIYELWLLSLLESDPNISYPYYSLHPLTRAFVLADAGKFEHTT